MCMKEAVRRWLCVVLHSSFIVALNILPCRPKCTIHNNNAIAAMKYCSCQTAMAIVANIVTSRKGGRIPVIMDFISKNALCLKYFLDSLKYNRSRTQFLCGGICCSIVASGCRQTTVLCFVLFWFTIMSVAPISRFACLANP